MNHYEPVKDSHSDASLEVRPDNRHLMGGNFTLRCSVNGGNSTGWILRRHQGAKNISGCLQLNGKESIDRPEDCHFIDIDSKNSGLYWCENTAGNKTSNTINITVVCKNISGNNIDSNHWFQDNSFLLICDLWIAGRYITIVYHHHCIWHLINCLMTILPL